MTDETRPSRSQRKRDVEALQKLGEQLLALRTSDLKTIPLSDKLREAISHAKSIDSRGALRRQKQYIGKIMRDEDGPAIAAAVERLQQPSRQDTARLHRAEKWRERLLDPSDATALNEFVDGHPGIDREALLGLVEAAKSATEAESTRAKRALFRFVLTALT